MINTEYGKFDGDKWETLCQICFKQNFRNEAYQEIKATPGDFGIEGFTRTGKAFQCYCPDKYYSAKELYEKHRDKITKDLNKLKTYESQLKKYLGDTNINKWYFVTPLFGKNEIIQHCTSKKKEVIDWELSIIDNDNFEVIFEEVNFLQPALSVITKNLISKINIGAEVEIEDKDKIKWKSEENDLIKIAKGKHSKRLPDSVHSSSLEIKLDKLTDISVSDYLEGEIILRKWENEYPEDFEKFISITSIVEKEVEEQCLIPSDTNNKLYKSFQNLLESRIKESFDNLDMMMVIKLTKRVMADWIFRCPISFE
ncbi:MAG: hypothetical protein K8S23_05115 [Candidatus Cloacimonetes bacterium]|nr:hypothetical protein [Candidatus Cloacimonadota bacterium]